MSEEQPTAPVGSSALLGGARAFDLQVTPYTPRIADALNVNQDVTHHPIIPVSPTILVKHLYRELHVAMLGVEIL
jgi:hypothetical protein